jgi:hypothetical protein
MQQEGQEMMTVTCGDIGTEHEIVRFEPLPEEYPIEEPVLVPAEPEKVPA